MQGIYRITSPKGYVYIGQSWRLERRWIEHISDSKYGKMFVSRSIKKYGADAHKYEIIHELPTDVDQFNMNEYEELYIQQYIDCGFKVMNSRGGGSNGRMSKETISKIIATKKRKKDSGILAPKGWKLSEDTKARMSKSMKGRVFKPESIKKGVDARRICNEISKKKRMEKNAHLFCSCIYALEWPNSPNIILLGRSNNFFKTRMLLLSKVRKCRVSDKVTETVSKYGFPSMEIKEKCSVDNLNIVLSKLVNHYLDSGYTVLNITFNSKLKQTVSDEWIIKINNGIKGDANGRDTNRAKVVFNVNTKKEYGSLKKAANEMGLNLALMTIQLRNNTIKYLKSNPIIKVS